MYKRLIFRYREVSIKTQRNDKGRYVCGLIRWPLSFEIVIIGKSVIAFNQEANESLRRKARAIQIVSLSGKISLRSTFFPYRKPTQVRRWKSTKAIGRQWFKELGNKSWA